MAAVFMPCKYSVPKQDVNKYDQLCSGSPYDKLHRMNENECQGLDVWSDVSLSLLLYLVLEDQQNPRLIKELLQDLSSTLCVLTRGMGKSVLVGNINIWSCRLETILNWQQQLNNLQIPRVGLLLLGVG